MSLPPDSPKYLDPASKISQVEFDNCSAQWLAAVSDGGDEQALVTSFGGAQRLMAVNFTLPQIIELLSAVGIQSIKARFLIKMENLLPRFTVALFATDGQGNRLTSYYLSDYQLDSAAGSEQVIDVEVANVLRARWADNWANSTQFPLTRQLFASAYGPLRGYNFSVSDFMTPMLKVRKEDVFKERFQLVLGLHTHFGPSPAGEVIKATFGLMAEITGRAVLGEGDDTAFDVAQPSPPAF